ncbi:hypothetical protein JKP88DRAFT_307603 [Tribonema minus]|uniref:DNA polymerase delta catalytic subunit n=1 Tax=Tribonema minus TaxID=303371 RepID=A0A836CI16_9STRA|nr:hypothetical protein JKP88DRAFT_307603 [Tribonema minus]
MKLFLLHAAYEKVLRQDGTLSWDRNIQIVARTSDGDTALVTVCDWSPYGYIKVPQSDLKCAKLFSKKVQEKFKAESVKVVERKQFIGFTNLKQQKYIMFRTKRWPVWQWERENVLEGGVKPFHKFFHETGLRSGAWFEVPDATLQIRTRDNPQSTCKRHYECRVDQLVPRTEDTTPPKLTIMAYDLETTGLDPEKCTINQVCLIFWDTTQAQIPEIGDHGEGRSVVICTQPTAAVKGTNVVEVKNERELLITMRQHILQHDPDIMTGYNLTFDNKFLMLKAAKYKSEWESRSGAARMTDKFSFYDAGRFPHIASYFQESQITNAAMGCNDRVLWTVSGRAVIDLMMYAKANFTSMPDYKLNTMSDMFIHEHKEDIVFGQIFEGFNNADKYDLRGEIAYYCAIDGRLCLQLMKHWSAHVSCMEEAAVACMNYADISTTGRQIKVVSMIQGDIYGEWVFNTPPPAAAGGYQGATVIEPTTGFYGGPTDQVVLLDFASLYPNLMRSHGVCPSRYVRDSMPDELAASVEEGVEIVRHHVGEGKVVKLAKPSDKADVPVFTKILTRLLEERKKVRKQMKTVTDPDELNVLDKRQLAKKVACNSAYGILGTTTGMMPLPDLAAVTTYQGRMALQNTIDIASNQYGAKIIGGDTDSVFVLLPHPDVVPEHPDDEWLAKRMEYVFKMSDIIGNHVTSYLHDTLGSDAMCLEGEGVMWPMLYYKKKNYAAMLYEPGKPPKMKMRGVVAIRNDWSRLTKELAGDVLRMAIQENNPTGALAHLRETLTKMRNGEIPSEMFVIKKQLHSYEPKTKSPHTQMAIRIRKKDPAAAPILGSKVAYVFRKGPQDISDRAYPPEDVAPADIDTTYYFERQLLKPMSELLSPMIAGGINKLRRLLENEQARQPEISGFIEGYTDKHEQDSTRHMAVLAPPEGEESKKKPRQAGLGMFGMTSSSGASKWAVEVGKPKRKSAQSSGGGPAKKCKQQTTLLKKYADEGQHVRWIHVPGQPLHSCDGIAFVLSAAASQPGITSIKRSLNLYNFERVTNVQGLRAREIAYHHPGFQQRGIEINNVKRQVQPASVKANNAKTLRRAEARAAAAQRGAAPMEVGDAAMAALRDPLPAEALGLHEHGEQPMILPHEIHEQHLGIDFAHVGLAQDHVPHDLHANDDFHALAGAVEAAGLHFNEDQFDLAEDIVHDDEINALLNEGEMYALIANVPQVEEALGGADADELQNILAVIFDPRDEIPTPTQYDP